MPGRRRRCGRVFAGNSGDGAGDWGNSIVRKVTPAGIITTVAGGGPAYGPPGDGGPVTGATVLSEGIGAARDDSATFFEHEIGPKSGA